MLKIFLYFLMLLLILFLAFNLLILNFNKAPKKIKIFTVLPITLVIIEAVSLIMLTIINNQINIIYFKPLVLLRFIYIPLIIWTCFYIFWRNFKVDFNSSYIIATTVSIIYIILMNLLDVKIQISKIIGYSILLKNQVYFELIYIGIIFLLLIICKININKECTNKIGINYIMGCNVVVSFEIFLKLINIDVFPYCLMGTIVTLWLATYSYSSFKK